MRNPTRLALLALFILQPLGAQEPLGTQVKMPVAPKEWQVRRAQTLSVIAACVSKPNDPTAYKAMDALLTDYEARPLTRTPLEALDLSGYFYFPKDAAETSLPVIVMDCTLGWYDALRFGSESGRAELVSKEHFFGRAYYLGGDASRAKITGFMQAHSDQVKGLVEQGFVFAARFRDVKSYDRHWPEAYGMEPMIGALGGTPGLKPLPEAEWDRAWEDAKAAVRKYYDVK
jgi:hypothetical protein